MIRKHLDSASRFNKLIKINRENPIGLLSASKYKVAYNLLTLFITNLF